MPSPYSQLLLLLLATTAHTTILAAPDAAAQQPITLAGCPEKCGDISIPYPFGMKPGCFRDGFEVICNYSFNPPRAFLPRDSAYHDVRYEYYSSDTRLTSSSPSPSPRPQEGSAPVELVDISASKSELRAYGGVTSDCLNPGSDFGPPGQVTRYAIGAIPFRRRWPPPELWPRKYYSLRFILLDAKIDVSRGSTTFLLSLRRNVLIGVGRKVKATFSRSLAAKCDPGLIACFSFAIIDIQTNGSCHCQGAGCCQASFPPDANVTFLDSMFEGLVFPTSDFAVTLDLKQMSDLRTDCSYGMVVERSWYNFSSEDMLGYLVLSHKYPRGVPVILDFAIRNRSCPAEGQQPLPQDYACISGNSSCAKPPGGDGYVCRCWDNYNGNPYTSLMAAKALGFDINECEHDHLNNFSRGSICKNTPGGYECPCKSGMRGDGKEGTCTEIFYPYQQRWL
ncbi:hypothetical protein ACQ4PT_010091 [Festuca glaucescens]